MSIRLGEDDRLCLLVLGVHEGGEKEPLAVEDGRESTGSWAAVLTDLKTRGLNVPSS